MLLTHMLRSDQSHDLTIQANRIEQVYLSRQTQLLESEHADTFENVGN